MAPLLKPWPLGLSRANWWAYFIGLAVLLGLALPFDRQLVLWAQSWPDGALQVLAVLTNYGESGWILYPTGALLLVTALLIPLVRWKLMKLLLLQMTQIYAFVFFGIGLPSLVSTLAKRIIGRGRPLHFDDAGPLSFHPNLADWTFQSFPSGHATTAFAMALVIAFLSRAWAIPALAFALAIAISRVALGAHYPTDVIAGAALGTIGAYAIRNALAGRRFVFEAGRDGAIRPRPLTSLRRYIRLKSARQAAR